MEPLGTSLPVTTRGWRGRTCNDALLLTGTVMDYGVTGRAWTLLPQRHTACVIVPLDAASGQREWGGVSVKNIDTHSLCHRAS